MRYIIVQRSMWSAFTLDIVEGAGRVVGEVRSPTLQARFERCGPPWRRRFELRDGPRLLATVLHPHRFTLRAQLAVDIAAGQPALPLVFAAYVINEIIY